MTTGGRADRVAFYLPFGRLSAARDDARRGTWPRIRAWPASSRAAARASELLPSFVAFERTEIPEVLVSSSCALRCDQIVPADDVNDRAVQLDVHPPCKRLLEVHSRDGSKKSDSRRRNAEEQELVGTEGPGLVDDGVGRTKRARARAARSRLSGAVPISRSRSLVNRGSEWTDTAHPPTMRYSTFELENAPSTSIKSGWRSILSL